MVGLIVLIRLMKQTAGEVCTTHFKLVFNVTAHFRMIEIDQSYIKEIPAPIDISNLMLADPKSGEPTRVGFRKENGKTVRYSKKSGEIIK